LEIQDYSSIDLSSKNQHGLKRNRITYMFLKRNSFTYTFLVELQSLIGRALDENEYMLMTSLNLSSAFDVVNTKILLKRRKIMVLPTDVVNLIIVWLKQKYVCIAG
jgi:hypothetical protein